MKSYIFPTKSVNKKQVQGAVFSSSKIEGLSFVRAKKNIFMVKVDSGSRYQ